VVRRRRITFVLTGRGLAGGNRVVAIYGNAMIKRGYDVTIVCRRPRLPLHPIRLCKRLYATARATLGLDRDHFDAFNGTFILTDWDALAGGVPDGDAVLATHWTTAEAVAGLSAKKGEKFYFIQHYEACSFDPHKVDATWRLPLRKIVVAGWLKDLARARFGDETTVVIPNGVDPLQFDAGPRPIHDPPCVGFMYSRIPWKGSAVAAEAIREARQAIPDLRVVCFGTQAPDKRLSVPTGTTFWLKPAQNRIRDIYALADVWLLPSTTEGFGLPGLEAMACRCPVIATCCGGPQEYLQDGVNGYLVPVGDAQVMAKRIVGLTSDESLHQRLSDAAYETRLRFAWESSVTAFERTLFGAGVSRGDHEPASPGGTVLSFNQG